MRGVSRRAEACGAVRCAFLPHAQTNKSTRAGKTAASFQVNFGSNYIKPQIVEYVKEGKKRLETDEFRETIINCFKGKGLLSKAREAKVYTEAQKLYDEDPLMRTETTAVVVPVA